MARRTTISTEESDTFLDFAVHTDCAVQVRQVNTHYGVELRRDGDDRFGERGRVVVYYAPDNGVRRNLVTYAGAIESAQGYAQGALDAMRLLFDRRVESDEELAPLEKMELPKTQCPRCGAPMKRIDHGPKGPFYGCTTYPKCRGFRTVVEVEGESRDER